MKIYKMSEAWYLKDKSLFELLIADFYTFTRN